MYNSILLPIDLSKGVHRAIDHAIDAAARYDADLHVLYVVDTDVYGSYSGDEYVPEFAGLEHALEAEGEEAIAAVAEQAREKGIDTVSVIRHGVPHEEILEYIDENDIESVVMGTKDRPGEYRQLLGSVTDRVTRMTSVPISIVKTPIHPE
jgi:nucleotide-binding universal stress UspA family protein